MEYISGGDLAHYLRRDGYFSHSASAYYVASCINALEQLHSQGIIHRDIKPDNIMLDDMGHIKLTDFGLSEEGLLIQKSNIESNSKP